MERERIVEFLKEVNELIETRTNLNVEIKNKSSEECPIPEPKLPSSTRMEYLYRELQKPLKINWWIVVALTYFTIFVGTIIYFIKYHQKKKNRLNMQNEYQMLLEEYNKSLEIYKEKHHEYLLQFSTWKNQKNAVVIELQNNVNNINARLKSLFDNNNYIPVQYQTVEALKYIGDMMTSSQFTLKETIDSYNEMIKIKIENARLAEIEKANQLTREQNLLVSEQKKELVRQNSLIDEQNKALNESNQIANEQNRLLKRQNSLINKGRKNNNLANAIGVLQHHNTNKILKEKK